MILACINIFSLYLKVFRHKTSSQHGAQNVTITHQVAPILSNFIENNIHAAKWQPHHYIRPEKLKKLPADNSPPLFDFPSGGFSAVWCAVRAKNPKIKEITNTANRHYVETMSKQHYSPNKQLAVSERLAHKPSVAAQSYMSNTLSMSLVGSALVADIQKTTNFSTVTTNNSSAATENNRSAVTESNCSAVTAKKKKAGTLSKWPSPETSTSNNADNVIVYGGKSSFGRQRKSVNKFM